MACRTVLVWRSRHEETSDQSIWDFSISFMILACTYRLLFSIEFKPPPLLFVITGGDEGEFCGPGAPAGAVR